MTRQHDTGAGIYCVCDSPDISANTCYKRSGYLIHKCGRIVACDFESGHRHAATEIVGEFNSCARHKAQAANL